MGQTIMIVDDEQRIRSLIALYLKKEGFEILEANDGVEALELFKKKGIDLIILDIMMPNMDGWEFCRRIRKVSDVPVIMLTAKSQEEDKLLGFDLGIDNYVTKPFSTKVLVAKVKALLKRAYPEEKEVNDFKIYDGLWINEKAHEVKINGEEELYLSPKEYELLIYLVNNKGIALTRDKLLDGVWGIDYYGDLRTVDTHVKRLREKLKDKAYLISTIRGSGYKFEVKK